MSDADVINRFRGISLQDRHQQQQQQRRGDPPGQPRFFGFDYDKALKRENIKEQIGELKKRLKECSAEHDFPEDFDFDVLQKFSSLRNTIASVRIFAEEVHQVQIDRRIHERLGVIRSNSHWSHHAKGERCHGSFVDRGKFIVTNENQGELIAALRDVVDFLIAKAKAGELKLKEASTPPSEKENTSAPAGGEVATSSKLDPPGTFRPLRQPQEPSHRPSHHHHRADPDLAAPPVVLPHRVSREQEQRPPRPAEQPRHRDDPAQEQQARHRDGSSRHQGRLDEHRTYDAARSEEDRSYRSHHSSHHHHHHHSRDSDYEREQASRVIPGQSHRETTGSNHPERDPRRRSEVEQEEELRRRAEDVMRKAEQARYEEERRRDEYYRREQERHREEREEAVRRREEERRKEEYLRREEDRRREDARRREESRSGAVVPIRPRTSSSSSRHHDEQHQHHDSVRTGRDDRDR